MDLGLAQGIYSNKLEGNANGIYDNINTGLHNGIYNDLTLYNKIIKNGLVLNYDAGYYQSYPKNGTTIFNMFGSLNNGTLTNGPVFNPENRGSILFDGNNDYILSANNIDISGTQSRTIDVWVYLNNSTARHVLCSWGNFFQTNLCNLEVNQIIGVNYPYFAGFNADAYVAQTIPINTWNNISLTYNGGDLNSANGIKIYINGFSKNVLFPAGFNSINTTNSRVSIGYEFAGSRNPMNGRIAIAKIYNRALSYSEILQNYLATKSRFNL